MAEKICLEIFNSDPKNLINLNLLGIILFKKEFTKAIEIIKNSIKLIQIKPKHIIILALCISN